MWYLLSWVALGIVLVYLVKKIIFPPLKIDPAGKIVLVTGAASGFGLATTKQLIGKGCFVIAVDINEEALEKNFGSNKDSVTTFHCDVSSTESVERLAQQVAKFLKEERGGVPLFGLVNNAGILLPPCSVLNTPESSLKKVMEINTFGMWRMSRSFISLIQTEGSDKGCIVNVTSVAGFLTVPFAGGYCMSKHAAEAFTDAMRREIRSTGIRVSMIEPYFANTPLLNAFEQRDAKIEGEDKDDIDKALSTLMQHVKLLPAESAANCICESLFTSPVPTRTQVSFWHDTILIFLLTKVLPDTWMDCILPILLAIGKPKEK